MSWGDPLSSAYEDRYLEILEDMPVVTKVQPKGWYDDMYKEFRDSRRAMGKRRRTEKSRRLSKTQKRRGKLISQRCGKRPL